MDTIRSLQNEIERLREENALLTKGWQPATPTALRDEIERLRGALDAVTTVEGNIMELERKATQRGARMQVMKDWMLLEADDCDTWTQFVRAHPEAAEWFDGDGTCR